MKAQVQSLSIVVPSWCLNNCLFCVSKMDIRKNSYKNTFDNITDLENEYIKRFEFAIQNNCDSIILTGQWEPVLNKTFLLRFGKIFEPYKKKFKKIELQTSWTTLTLEYLQILIEQIWITGISLSITDFSNKNNSIYQQTPTKYIVNLKKLCKEIKSMWLNLRISINMTDRLNKYEIKKIFDKCKEFWTDQITFRLLYKSKTKCDQNIWIDKHNISKEKYLEIKKYIKLNWKNIWKTIYWNRIYLLNNMWCIIDDDSMNSKKKIKNKYLILRENAKLYSLWNDPSSIVF